MNTATLNGTIDFLGQEAALKFLNLMIGTKDKKNGTWMRDCRFGVENVERIYPQFFTHNFAKKISDIIIRYYNKERTIPYYDDITFELKKSMPDNYELYTEYLNDIKNVDSTNFKYFKKESEKYLKFHRVKLANEKINAKIKSNDYESLDTCLDLIKEALKLQMSKTGFYKVEEGNHNALEENKRHPIPTGMGEVFDEILNGGIAKGELALFIAALGAGKTTLATYLANEAFKLGYKVLQVIFEDTVAQIQLKQYATWNSVQIQQIVKAENKNAYKRGADKVIKKAKEKGGEWIIKRFDTGKSTTDDLEELIEDLRSQGIIIDMVLIDYLECFTVKNKKRDDEWKNEGDIIRDLENMCSENNHNFACIAFTQGSRGSWNTKSVDVIDMGGDWKKAKVAHIIVTIARTNKDKKSNLATVAILKSRAGDSGDAFKDVYFDASRVKVRIESDNYIDIEELLDDK